MDEPDLAVDFFGSAFFAAVFFATVEVDFLPPVSFGARRDEVLRGGSDLTSASSAGPASSPSRDSRAARTLFSSAAIRSSTFPGAASSRASGGRSPAALAATTSSTASRYSSCRSSRSISPRVSMRASARSSSWSRTVTPPSGATPSGARTSSGHSRPCIAMASPTTRSMPRRSRPRSANLAIATRLLRLSASRNSVYGLAAGAPLAAR